MLKTIFEITTPTQTIKIPADDGKGAAIQSCTLTECVNSGEELTIGSTFACSLEATLMLVDGNLNIQAGDIVKVSKQLDNNEPTPVGSFILERPTRVTANTMKIVGYDYVSKLDKDLTAWLAGLKGWPYKLNAFAAEVCKACGLDFKATKVPNMDYEIQQFSKSSVTGRQLMRWLGELCCSFCRADAEGNIEFAWYAPADVKITTDGTDGNSYYFQNGLTYENYDVAPVTAVQLRLANAENGALWPTEGVDVTNSYIITGNPILTSKIDQKTLLPILDNILPRLAETTYTPCTVSLPASMNIRAGNTVQITDKNNKTITAYIMTKTQTGQKDTLECTGSARRDSSSAVNNKTQQEKTVEMENYVDTATTAVSNQAGSVLAEAKDYANAAAQNAVNAQTAQEILDKLTDNGNIQGIYQQDGKWYINAEVVQIVNLVADIITAGVLRSEDGSVQVDLNNNRVTIDGTRDGYKTQVVLSSTGIDGYGESTEGVMEHVLSILMGVAGLPSGLWNDAWQQSVGLSIGTACGPLELGTTESNVRIIGDYITIESVAGAISLAGKTISWRDNGDGTSSLISYNT